MERPNDLDKNKNESFYSLTKESIKTIELLNNEEIYMLLKKLEKELPKELYIQTFNYLCKLNKIAFFDELTGANTRGYFNAICQKKINCCENVFLAFIDSDNMKEINDNYGHGIGDSILQKLVRHIKDAIDTNVDVIRWGGDEFLLIFYDKNQEEISHIILDIQQSIAHDTSDNLPEFSFTCGVAKKNHDETVYSFIERADMLMIKLKHSDNKNSVQFANNTEEGFSPFFRSPSKYYKEILNVLESNKGRNNFYLLCNLEISDELLDESGNPSTYLVNQIGKTINKYVPSNSIIYMVNNTQFAVILKSPKNDFFENIEKRLPSIIMKKYPEVADKISLNIIRQEILSKYKPQEIIDKTNQKLQQIRIIELR